MGNICLAITIIFYIITAYLLILTVFTKHQASAGYDVDWENFRLKVPKWGITTIILGGFFNVLYILTT